MLVAALMAVALLSGGAAQDTATPPTAPTPPAAPVVCDTGPVEREYGGLTWMVFGCSNGGVIFGGKPETAAASSMFVWAPSGDSFELTLESPLEDRAPLMAAATELAALTPADLEVLIAETRAATR